MDPMGTIGQPGTSSDSYFSAAPWALLLGEPNKPDRSGKEQHVENLGETRV